MDSQQDAHVADGGQRVGMLIAKDAAANVERLGLRRCGAIEKAEFTQGLGHGLEQPRLDQRLILELLINCFERSVEDVLIERVQSDVREVHTHQRLLEFLQCRLDLFRRHRAALERSAALIEDVAAQADAHHLGLDLRQLARLELRDLLEFIGALLLLCPGCKGDIAFYCEFSFRPRRPHGLPGRPANAQQEGEARNRDGRHRRLVAFDESTPSISTRLNRRLIEVLIGDVVLDIPRQRLGRTETLRPIGAQRFHRQVLKSAAQFS